MWTCATWTIFRTFRYFNTDFGRTAYLDNTTLPRCLLDAIKLALESLQSKLELRELSGALDPGIH